LFFESFGLLFGLGRLGVKRGEGNHRKDV